MSDRVDLQEFIGGFIAEADELVAAANVSLTDIAAANAAGSSHPRAVRDLFRALHTIKGLAGMIGVEPIVEIAHALETLLRTADRAGGILSSAAVEVTSQGVDAIADRVRAVAEQREPRAVPEHLLEQIASADGAQVVSVAPPIALKTEWDTKLAPGERQQLAIGVRSSLAAWAVSFTPSERNAANGVTIASVRERLGTLGEIVKVVPRATPGQASSIAFDILVLSKAPVESLAEAAATTIEHVVAVLDPPESADEAPVPAMMPAAVSGSMPVVPARPAIEIDELAPSTEVSAIGRSLVRVDLARLDELQEQLSGLIVSRFRLEREIAAIAAHGHDVRELKAISSLQSRQLRDLRRAILRARMVRVAEVLEPLALLVRSLARTAQKEVRLELDARDAELDKTVADRLLPALVHLVRNAVDHAIEPGEERLAKGKPRGGLVKVSCTTVGSNRLELVVRDDGRGIDRAAVGRRAGRVLGEQDDEGLLDILTTPGFSTQTVATRTSGRGFGMDIVRRIIVRELGGELRISTSPAGTAFTLEVPLTIAVVEVFSFECGKQSFVVPVSAIEEIFELAPGEMIVPPRTPGPSQPAGMLERRGRAVPVLSLGTVLAIDSGVNARKAMVIRRNGEPVAFAVDRMIGRQEVVVRPVDDPLVRTRGIAGSTDLGDGKPTLVLDLAALVVGSRERRV